MRRAEARPGSCCPPRSAGEARSRSLAPTLRVSLPALHKPAPLARPDATLLFCRAVRRVRSMRTRTHTRMFARAADAGEARARRWGPGLCVRVYREDPEAPRERGWEEARGAGSGRGLMHHFPGRVRVGRRLHFALTRGNPDPHGIARAPSASPAPPALENARAEHAPQIDLLCVAGAARRTV